MNLNDIPKPASGKISTRDLIINILSLKGTATSKEVYSMLTKEFSKSVSYQAAHKILQELLSEEVIVKKDKNYSINNEWVEKLSTYVGGLSGKPLQSSLKAELDEKGFAIRSYDTPMGIGRFCVNEFLQLPANRLETVCFLYHMWPFIGFSGEEVATIKEIFSRNQYLMLSEFNTPTDIVTKNFFEDVGSKVVLGIPLSFEVDIVVHGDYVAYFHFNLGMKRNWDRLCRLNKRFEGINWVKFLKLISMIKFPADAIVIKHPELAARLRAHGKELAGKK